MTIFKGRFRPQHHDSGKRLRINDMIRSSTVRLIDDDNEQIGVVSLDEAKRRAREAGLDLVEVSPASSPPVCRVMDYGKWKYQQRKKEQKARSHSKHSELKEVRVRPKIDGHDLKIKAERAREFLREGDKVQFTLQFRGREMAHQELGLQTLNQIKELLADVCKVETEPRMMGKRVTMVLAPDQKGKVRPAAPKPAKAETGTQDKPGGAATRPSAPAEANQDPATQQPTA